MRGALPLPPRPARVGDLYMPCEEDAGDAVLKEVGDDARPQASAPDRERTEQAAVDGDDHDHLPALIGVREAEEDALDEGSDERAFRVGRELTLKIAAEDGLLTDAGGEGDEEVDGDLEGGVGEQRLQGRVVVGDAQKSAEEAEHDVGDDEEEEREADVAEDLPEVRGHFTEEAGEGNALDAETKPDEAEDEPLDDQDQQVACEARRERAEEMMARVQAERNPGGEQKKDAEEMPERRNRLEFL